MTSLSAILTGTYEAARIGRAMGALPECANAAPDEFSARRHYGAAAGHGGALGGLAAAPVRVH